ncbi:hypothetical protein EST38_g2584 [Candolleomyces aberdarensis]|uniref:AA9 family lytic polysaccharide monooxygenase n=1 Tax=Candolleomyces aberdarensis TaxID=2316362 RepID=A0A4Q2DU84_9AGAR|nr:hypothetical protein EST38_g2584 [Candolleomyces aberdarensis]
MRLASFIALASAVAGTLAHTELYSVWVNNVDQGNGRGVYIRSPPSNYPLKDLTSPNLNCNVNGDKAVPRSVSVKYGDKLTFEWGHNARGDDIIDASHKGPILVYMRPASGKNWTKVFEANFNGQSWATERLRDARGQHSIFIPDVPAGDYLFRAEVIALHEADAYYTNNPARGVQLFPSCVQVRVTSNGKKALPAGGAVFPGTYKNSSPGIFFNLYKGGPPHASYYSPGPATWYEAKLKDGYIGQVGTPRNKRFVAAPPAN